MNTPVKAPLTCLSLFALLLLPAARATAATSDDTPRQSYNEAWWTGPLLASGASALPHGNYLIEPYLYDVVVRGVYDSAGEKHTVAREDGLRSLTYLLYGLTDATTVGLIPRFGYNASGHGTHSSGPQIGDLTLHAHHQFLKFREGHWQPALSVVLEQTLPTGRCDRLGSNPGDGLGAGVFATTFALYMQRYFWVPNGRIVRTRLDVAYTHAQAARISRISASTAHAVALAARRGQAIRSTSILPGNTAPRAAGCWRSTSPISAMPARMCSGAMGLRRSRRAVESRLPGHWRRQSSTAGMAIWV